MKNERKNPYHTNKPSLHIYLFSPPIEKRLPSYSLPFPKLPFASPWQALPPSSSSQSNQRPESSTPCIPLLQRSRPASAPAAPTAAAAAGSAVRAAAAASSPSPSFLAPLFFSCRCFVFLELSRIHTCPKNQTNKETKPPESSSSTISSHFIHLDACTDAC